MKIEKIFDLDKKTTLFILLASTILTIAMIIKISKPNEKQNWQIIKDGEYHLTSDPVVSGSCVEFTDENGKPLTICGGYKMKKI
jgi:hypothetical protein